MPKLALNMLMTYNVFHIFRLAMQNNDYFESLFTSIEVSSIFEAARAIVKIGLSLKSVKTPSAD